MLGAFYYSKLLNLFINHFTIIVASLQQMLYIYIIINNKEKNGNR